MAYTITKSDGTALGTVADGTLDTSSTSLNLVGRNYSNYGQAILDNFVSLVENFSKNTAPANPLEGQLWWDKDDDLLKIYTGSAWKILSSATASSSAPATSVVAGDLWFDTDDSQLYAYDGVAAAWVLIGPSYSKTLGKSGAIWEQIEDNTSASHNVVSLYLDGVRTGIINTDSVWTPNIAIPGFTTIGQGHNIRSTDTLWGTANNSSYLGGQPAANYLRSDVNDITTGALAIQNDTGLEIGASNDLAITVSGTDVEIRNVTSDGDVSIFVNDGGVDTEALHVNGADAKATFSGTVASNALEVTTTADITTNMTVGGTLAVTGNVTAPTQARAVNDTTVATTAYVTTANVDLKGYTDGQLATKANLASPTLTGNPTAPTPTAGDNDTSIATTAFVEGANVNLKGYTDGEVTTINSALSLKAPLASPTLTGTPAAPTASFGTDTTQLATTAFVQAAYDRNKISIGDSKLELLDAGTGSANLVLDGTSVMTASASGVALKAGANAVKPTVTQGNFATQTGNAWVASTSYVRDAAQYWDGSKKWVSNVAPTSADGIDGDFWFQYAS